MSCSKLAAKAQEKRVLTMEERLDIYDKLQLMLKNGSVTLDQAGKVLAK